VRRTEDKVQQQEKPHGAGVEVVKERPGVEFIPRRRAFPSR